MNTTINIGDYYYNPKAIHLGIRIATEQTLKNIAFSKAIAYGQCYYVKIQL